MTLRCWLVAGGAALVALVANGACVSGEFADGWFACDADRAPECPPGLSCARDGRCRAPGSFEPGPDAAREAAADAADAQPTETAAETPVNVVGNSRDGAAVDTTPNGGYVTGFRFVASATATVGRLFVRLDATNAARDIEMGLYTEAFDAPKQLLTRGAIAETTAGWNSVAVTPAQVSAGTTYWIALASKTPGEVVTFNEDPAAPSQTKTNMTYEGNHTELPATWNPGADGAALPVCAYAAAL